MYKKGCILKMSVADKYQNTVGFRIQFLHQLIFRIRKAAILKDLYIYVRTNAYVL